MNRLGGLVLACCLGACGVKTTDDPDEGPYRLVSIVPRSIPLRGAEVTVELRGAPPAPDAGVFYVAAAIDGGELFLSPISPGTPHRLQFRTPTVSYEGHADVLLLTYEPEYQALSRLVDAVEFVSTGPPVLNLEPSLSQHFEPPLHAELANVPCPRGGTFSLDNAQGNAAATGLTFDAGPDYAVDASGCGQGLGLTSSCEVTVCLTRSRPGLADASLTVQSREGARAAIALHAEVLPPVEGLDPSFTPFPFFTGLPNALEVSHAGLITFEAGRARSYLRDGGVVELTATDALDATLDPAGTVLLMTGDRDTVSIDALDDEGHPQAFFDGGSRLRLSSQSSQRLWVTSRSLLVLSGAFLRSYSRRTGAFEWLSEPVMPGSAILASGFVTADDHFHLASFNGPSKDAVEVDEHGVIVDHFQGVFAAFSPAPDGGVLLGRADTLMQRANGQEHVFATAPSSSGVMPWRSVAFDGRGRMLWVDGGRVHRWTSPGIEDRSWPLEPGQLWCPQVGGCFVATTALWRLSDD